MTVAAKRIGWIVIGASCLLTVPALVTVPSAGIDPSWELGLHLARDHGIVVGRDVFFNYGPWGFLNVPMTLARPLWLAAVAYRFVVQLALFLAVGLWMQRRLGGWGALLPAIPLVLFIPPPEYRLLLALLLWTRLALDTEQERPHWAASLGAAAAATVMIKFSVGLAALMIVAGGAAAAWWLHRWRSMLALVAGFATGVVAWGLVALGSLEAVGRFLEASAEIAIGYGTALARLGPLWQPVLVLAACLLLVLGLLRVRREQLRRHIALIVPAAGLLLLTFKHAFVRHETHAFLALGVGSVVLSWIALESAGYGGPVDRGLRAAGVLALVAGALIVSPPAHLLRLPSTLGRNVGQALQASRETRDAAHRARLSARLRRALPLHERARELIGDRTVDILTVEVSMAEAWGLNWRPRPVLQSYAVATSRLDDLDASFFAGPSAPERLLVNLQGLDTRHPFMDAPKTWRQILSRYRPLGRDARWLVLGLRERPRRWVETPLQRMSVPLNRLAPTPVPATGHLEMRVHLEPSLLGRLVALPWKRPEIRLGLIADDATPPRRILPATSRRPFPITRGWTDTPEDLWNLYADPDWSVPRGVAFVTRGAWAWKDPVIEFYQVEWLDPACKVAPPIPRGEPGPYLSPRGLLESRPVCSA
jgi:hypothetical protein